MGLLSARDEGLAALELPGGSILAELALALLSDGLAGRFHFPLEAASG